MDWVTSDPRAYCFLVGDVALATGAFASAFAAPSTYAVTATVADAAGNSAAASEQVKIGPAPQPVQPTLPALTRDTRAPQVKLLLRGRTLVVTSDERGTLTANFTRRGHRARRLGRTIGRGTHRITIPRLTPGAWRATITLTDAAGNRSRPAQVTVRVKRPRTPPRARRAA